MKKMDKSWLHSYPDTVPPTISTDAYRSVVDVLERSLVRFRNRPAFECLGESISYQTLDQQAEHFAGFLQNCLHLEPGARVAIMMPNLLQYPVVMFGILRAGLVVVNVNPKFTPAELKHQLNDAEVCAIVVAENHLDTLEQVIDDTPVAHVITTQIGDLLPAPRRLAINIFNKYIIKSVPKWKIARTTALRTALKQGEATAYKTVNLCLDDLAFLQYTGGTTGLAKGAELTHGNLVANLEQVSAWVDGYTEPGREIVVTALPLYHIFALVVNCLVFMKLGAKNLLIVNPQDLPAAAREISKYQFSVISGVNTLFNGLLNTPNFQEADFSRLKFTLGGGAAILPRVAERWQALTGKPIIEGYGLTETSPVASVNRLDIEAFTGSIGLPLPSTEFSIRNEKGKEVAVGEAGELCIRGPQVMRGYWNKPEENKTVFTKDGFLRTGDIATCDEHGYFSIVDRKKDMILVSGFNVYPNEIEALVSAHDGVLECACVGVPDTNTGEAVKLYVVKANPALRAEELLDLCSANLTAYKRPRSIAFCDELPKTSIGKVLRRSLKP